MSGILGVLLGDNAAAGGGSNSAAYTNFIARTSGLDSTHLSAYAGLLDGLTTDGIFNSDGTSSYLDIFYVFATKDATTANLNIVNTSFTGTPNSCSFSADAGYTSASSTLFDSNYNPTTNATNYATNSACIFAWSNTAGADAHSICGIDNTGTIIFPSYDGTTYYAAINNLAINDSFTNAGGAGLYLANRSGATACQYYKNASSLGTSSTAAVSAANANIKTCGSNGYFSARQVSCFGAGASMNSTVEGNFYARLRTYMTAVGVP